MWHVSISTWHVAHRIFQISGGQNFSSTRYDYTCEHHFSDCQVHTPPRLPSTHTARPKFSKHALWLYLRASFSRLPRFTDTHRPFLPFHIHSHFPLHYFSLFLGNPLIELVTRRKVAPLSLTQVKVHWRRPFIINLWKSIGISILCLR